MCITEVALLILQEFDLRVQLCQLYPSCLQAAVVWGSGPSPCQFHQQHLEQVTDQLRSPNKTQLQRLAATPPRQFLSVFNLQFHRGAVMLAEGMSAFHKHEAGEPCRENPLVRSEPLPSSWADAWIDENNFLLSIHSDILYVKNTLMLCYTLMPI